jgi:serine/threonine protein phosphatase PrpC
MEPTPTANGIGGKRKHDEVDAAPTPELAAAVCTSVGTRSNQEDRYILVRDAWAGTEADCSSWPACRFFGVFDGHSGNAAAELVSTLLWRNLQAKLVLLLRANPEASSEVLERAVRDAFAETDERVVAEAGSSGATATCALVLGEKLCIVNLGDSRTVLCRSERCFFVTADHKPDVPSERARIEALGGYVATPRAAGQINVPRLNGVLSVSRAFGDAQLKPNGAGGEAGEGGGGAAVDGAADGGAAGDGAAGGARVGGRALSAEPEVTHRVIDRFDSFVLQASDIPSHTHTLPTHSHPTPAHPPAHPTLSHPIPWCRRATGCGT